MLYHALLLQHVFIQTFYSCFLFYLSRAETLINIPTHNPYCIRIFTTYQYYNFLPFYHYFLFSQVNKVIKRIDK